MSSVPQSTGMGNTSGQDSWSIPGASSALSTAGSALGAYRGIQSGTPLGYASAAINSGKLAGKLGAFGASNSALNQGFGDAANALGIYSGIKQGGVGGYGGAAINAGQLGLKGAVQSGMLSKAGAAPYLSALNYAAIPLDLYNEVNSWESGNTGSDALSGAETGAAVGSVIPGIGTVIGGLIGGAAGALSSAFGPGRKDPESYDYGSLTHAYNQAGQQGGRQAEQDLAGEVQNPYEALAGMFDLRSGQVDKGDTLYNEYGRMGEQKFTGDLVNQLNQAKASGKIDPNMDASQIYSSVVQPWEDSWGKGQNTDTNAQLQQDLVTQMISQYEGGQAADDWRSVGGEAPFASIYQGAPQTWGQSAKTQAAPMAAKSPTLDRLGNPMQGYADGGRAKRKSILDNIRPDFVKARKTHFDDGGDVSYVDPVIDSGPTLSNDIYSNPGELDIANQEGVDSINNPYGDTGTGGGSLSSLAHSAAPYASLLPLLSGLLNKSGASGQGKLPIGMTSGPTGPFQAQSSPRTSNPIDPNTDWYTYGQHPEKEFFSNNSIGPLMGKFAQQPSSAFPAPPASPPGNMQPMPIRPGDAPPPVLRSHGGALDSLGDGTPVSQGSRYVRGPGDGQSDDIDAKLSDGEYVFDAHTVSMLGNGSNEAGAKRLDQLRENLRKAAAKPMAKGKQFMKAKSPEAYLQGGKKKPLAFDVEGEG